VVVLGLLGGIAAADANYTMAIGVSKTDPTRPACDLAADGKPSRTGSLQVRFTLKDQVTLSSVTTAPSVPVVQPPDGTDPVATIDVKSMKDTDALTLTAVTDKGPVDCPSVRALADRAPAPQPAAGAAAPDDRAASRWWLSDHGASALDALKRRGKQRGLPDDARFLVYLPSGQPAFPTPTSLREGTPVQIVMIQPVQGGPTVAVTTKSCAAFKAFRVAGDDGTTKQGGDGGLDPATAVRPEYELAAVGPYLRCGAGSLAYDLTFKPGAADAVTVAHTLEVRPEYSFALLTTLGFDSTISHDFQAVPAMGGGSTVAAKHDRVGPSILIGGQWMVGGVDYTDMRWYNYLLNPFIAFDAASPLTGFVVGDTLTIRGGISLAFGLAAHRGTRLKGVQLGDALSGGDVPKDDTWHEQRLGFFIGAAFDSKVFEALKAH
jgi:hypothetical protein